MSIIDARNKFPLKNRARLVVRDDGVVDEVRRAQLWEQAREAHRPDFEKLAQINAELARQNQRREQDEKAIDDAIASDAGRVLDARQQFRIARARAKRGTGIWH